MQRIKKEMGTKELMDLFDESIKYVADVGMIKDVSFSLMSEEKQKAVNETFVDAGQLFANYVKEVFFYKLTKLVSDDNK